MSMFGGKATGRGTTLLDQGGLAHALRREVGDTQALFNEGVKFTVAADVLVSLLDAFDLLTEPARAHHPVELQVLATMFAVADFNRLRAERYGDTEGENAWALAASEYGTALRQWADRAPDDEEPGWRPAALALLVRDIDILVHRLVDGGDGTRVAQRPGGESDATTATH